MVNQKQILLTALLAVQAKGVEQIDIRGGICCAVEHETMNVDNTDYHSICEMMREMFRAWPEFAGDTYFPVPSGSDEHPADIYFRVPNLWVDQYGEARLRLLDFMIEQLQSEAE